ncbi:branched-chain amino acid transport system ATP-binding protein [Lachnotalea glycerini]|uniref:ABC transporter ATP-binding protein n=1 Tax=Lachnotalea glycerini TaxID=1763509 RepID=A0A255IK73_9FIRM|nr:ABC transporter ATP-binding protein [Lachnotalea glycerini]PXV91618.1 branched-chain amino acid transport system ATP-binding protein [Lachnotalea glycerini]RDY28448.1 ABC transporter ATP-binding protein [Lachnotalea glycerini]
MTQKYFQVDRINVCYGDIQVLWDTEFYVDKGEIIAIVGSNGAGKSTIVKTCAGLIGIKSGSIYYNGAELAGKTSRQFIDLGVILVPEGRQLFPNMTVYENLEIGASSKEAKAKKKETVEKIFEWFPILKERKNQQAGTLSGGEQQMVAFSRGMMGLPKLLMMDEPSLGLAPNIVDNIFLITKKIAKEEGISIVLVEQDVRKALRIANRAYVLENGVVRITGTASELLSNAEVKKAYLGF